MKHPFVTHPKDILSEEVNIARKFNDYLAVRITKAVGSMWCAYIFLGLDIVELPPVIKAHDVITWINYIAQTVLQLVLLPVIMVGQNVISAQNEAKADADHLTLTYLAQNSDKLLEAVNDLKTVR